jgi:hypothetical protein
LQLALDRLFETLERPHPKFEAFLAAARERFKSPVD